MRRTIRRSGAVMILATFVALMTFMAAAEARAQCMVLNNTGCSLFLTVFNAGGARYTQLIPGGGGPVVYNMPAAFMPIGVVDANNVMHPFLPAPPAIGCTPCIPLRTPPPLPPCCGIVCYDPAACVFHIHPCPAPC